MWSAVAAENGEIAMMDTIYRLISADYGYGVFVNVLYVILVLTQDYLT